MSEVAQDTPAPPETQSDATPRIYVASLSDYNAGRLHGEWLNAAREPDEVQTDIDAMLAGSREPGAEGWAIHDYENFGPVRLSEYESLDLVSVIARGIVAHGEAFAAWAFCHYQPTVETLERFEEMYRGRWDSLTAYADDLLDDLGATQALEQVPGWLQPYVSIESAAFARDLALSGDLVSVPSNDGGVHVFEGSES